MPRRKVREYQAKKLLASNITSYFPLTLRCAQVTPTTDFGKLLDDNHWLENERLVVKPDMLFGKRGKNNLVLLNATYPEAQKFIRACYKVFVECNFHFMELNPFTLTNIGGFPLDMRGEVDDCALFRNTTKWKVDGQLIEFPSAFGVSFTPEEKLIQDMDEKTGASLKLTVLNPQGRIWAMVAGGGASVIYADTVADLGFGHELGNYGEYSGDPSEAETYQYALTLLSFATRNSDGRPKALIIGGAVANFTDVAATFSGIIRAIRENVEKIKQANIKVFVRRGGPNYQIGLQKMKDLSTDTKIPFEVYGPDVHMTKIVKMAIDWISPASSL